MTELELAAHRAGLAGRGGLAHRAAEAARAAVARPSRRVVLTRALALAAIAHGAPAQAAELPSTVTIVVPFAPGGGADQLVRELVAALREPLPGVSFVVENQPGANGALASRAFARRRADGSVLLLGTSSTLPLNAATKKLEPEVLRDLAPVALLAETANALAVASSSPWRSLAEYLASGRRTEISYASFGPGSSGHLYGLLLQSETGARLLHVPYKGSAPALTDLLGGHVQSAFLTTSAIEAGERDGRLRVLAVTGTRRSANLPQVPTFHEQGVGSLGFNGWFGLFAPAGSDARTLRPIAEAVRGLSRNAAFVGRMTEQGYAWSGEGAERMAQELRGSLDAYTRVAAEHAL